MCERFNLEEKQAIQFLKPGVVLKKQLAQQAAELYRNTFMDLGLEVEIFPYERQLNKKEQLKSVDKLLANTTSVKLNRQYLNSLFKHEIPVAPLTVGYKLGLVAVAFLSLLAPAMYFITISALSFAIYEFTLFVIHSWSGSGVNLNSVVLMIVPILFVLLLILLMFKPLITRSKGVNGIKLDAKHAPNFFLLVELMCKRIGVPIPTEIYMDNRVNASAGPAHGLVSLLQGKLILTIGLPLVAGMNARQLVGVLAHEFGHFAQPTAMFAYYLITSINGWLAESAYNEDLWDHRLDFWKNSAEKMAVIGYAVRIVQWGILSTRMLLKGLFLINLRVTRYMSRHMEYHADHYEAYVAGSDHFRGNSLHLRSLFSAYRLVTEANHHAWNHNMLLNNVPDAVAWQNRQFGSGVLRKLEQGMAEEVTNVWDSHPADNDRIIHAEAPQFTAIFKDVFPARHFFINFKDLCKKITLYEYQMEGLETPKRYVVENKRVLAYHAALKKSDLALTRYFKGLFSRRLMCLELPAKNDLLTLDLQGTVDWLRSQQVGYGKGQQNYRAIQKYYREVSIGLSYIKAEIDIDPLGFNLPNTDPELVNQLKIAEDKKLLVCRKKLELVDTMFYQRIQLAIHSMSENDQRHCKQLLATLRNITQLKDNWMQLDDVAYLLEILLDNGHIEIIVKIQDEVNENATYCSMQLAMLTHASGKIPNRMAPSGEESLRDFIVSWVGEQSKDADQMPAAVLVEKCDQVLRAIQYQYVWMFGELVRRCEIQEKELGIKPLNPMGIMARYHR